MKYLTEAFIGIAIIALAIITLVIVVIVDHVGINAVLMWLSRLSIDKITIITAIATIVIAVIALWANIREGKETRKHNRLLVRPSLFLRLREELVENKHNVRESKIVIVNNGIGVAFIKKIIREIDGKKFTAGDFQKYRRALAEIVETPETITCNGISSATIMKPGEEIELIGFQYTSEEKKIATLKKIKLFLEYQSVYEEKFKPLFFIYDSKTMGE
ncbi:MAG: hypothetical protein K8953_04435 [Proteobacteria bacterium]|nr:hypothetical protein [Pseudomonadota bacterium]